MSRLICKNNFTFKFWRIKLTMTTDSKISSLTTSITPVDIGSAGVNKIFNFTVVKSLSVNDLSPVYKVNINSSDNKKGVIKILDANDYQNINELICCMLFKHPTISSYSEIHTPTPHSDHKDLSDHSFGILFEAGGKDSPLYRGDDSNLKKYLYNILSAIDYIHQMGFIHGDLKAKNIVTFDDNPKVIDFGLSVLHDTDVKRDHTHLLYTCYNRPPELINEEKQKISTAFDVWALGITFFELLGCLEYFTRKYKTIEQLYCDINSAEVYTKDHESLYNLWTSGELTKIFTWILHSKTKAPNDLIELIMWMLTVDPNKRPSIKDIMRHKYFTEVHHGRPIIMNQAVLSNSCLTMKDGNIISLLKKLLLSIRTYKDFLGLTPKQGILALDILYQLVEYTYYQPNIKSLIEKNIILDAAVYLAKSLSGDICYSESKALNLIFKFIIDKSGVIYKPNLGTYTRNLQDMYHSYDVMLNRPEEYLKLSSNCMNSIIGWFSKQEEISITRIIFSSITHTVILSCKKQLKSVKQIVKLLL